MPNVQPPTTTPERYAELIASEEQNAIVDFNHNPAPTQREHIAELASMGALGFKVYMVVDSKRSYPHMPGLGVHEHGDLLKISELVAAAGRVLMVHPNDQSLLDVLEERAWAARTSASRTTRTPKPPWTASSGTWRSPFCLSCSERHPCRCMCCT